MWLGALGSEIQFRPKASPCPQHHRSRVCFQRRPHLPTHRPLQLLEVVAHGAGSFRRVAGMDADHPVRGEEECVGWVGEVYGAIRTPSACRRRHLPQMRQEFDRLLCEIFMSHLGEDGWGLNEANRIHLYIESNPVHWAEDEENR